MFNLVVDFRSAGDLPQISTFFSKNLLIMGYYKDRISKSMETPSEPFRHLSCTVPNGSLTPRELYNLYAKGQPLPPSLGGTADEGNELRQVYVPRDPMEALQMSRDYVASLQRAAVEQQLTFPVNSPALVTGTSSGGASEASASGASETSFPA